MAPKILGIDISDNGTRLMYYGSEEGFSFPTLIGRKKDIEEWSIGEQAYAAALSGNTVITDKLYSLLKNDVTTTLGHTTYRSIDIFTIFLEYIIRESIEKSGGDFPEIIVACIPKIEKDVVEKLYDCFTALGYLKENTKIISRPESFIYYTLSQTKEIYKNQVGLFYLSDISLSYYELKINRTSSSMTIYAEGRDLDEAFNLDILNTPSGTKLADKVMSSVAAKYLDKKLFSSVMLTGKGFDKIDWGENFIKLICNRRKAFVDADLFAKGASYRGLDLASEKNLFPYKIICDGRLDTNVFVNVEGKDKEWAYFLANAGEAWYENEKNLRLIPDNKKGIDISLISADNKKKRNVFLPLDFMPQRPIKTWRINLKTSFKDEKTMLFHMQDAGFGEIYPSSEKEEIIEVGLWE